MDDWEQIESPNLRIPSSQSKPFIEKLIIRDDFFNGEDCSVFPPENHEGLSVPPRSEDTLSPSSSTDEEVSEERDWSPKSKERSLGVRLSEASRSLRISPIAFNVKSLVGVTTSFGVIAAVATSLMYLNARMKRWRRKVVEENLGKVKRLLLLLQERDEKISSLLLQIAKLNEILAARRRVPVFRSA
ncbi:hypothetical protein RJ641_003074 [Dillenia turbinata]|uniref:Transmembrane protein n=1 Tax=Dillenia turbinata TaxID=194707 RepID=A0AAN8VJY3_9MAGN